MSWKKINLDKLDFIYFEKLKKVAKLTIDMAVSGCVWLKKYYYMQNKCSTSDELLRKLQN